MLIRLSTKIAIPLLLSVRHLIRWENVLSEESNHTLHDEREKLDQLEFFQGVWRCKGRQNLPPPLSEEFNSTWQLKRELNDWWFIGQTKAVIQDSVGI